MGTGSKPQVWNQTDLRKWGEKTKEDVSRALSLPRGLGIATLLLRRYHWRPERVKEEWLQRRDRFCRDVGLQWPADASRPVVIRTSLHSQHRCQNRCSHAASQPVFSAGCSHYYCDVCWHKYIADAVDKRGRQFLSLRCPVKSCGAAVLWKLMDKVADAGEKKLISDYISWSPVDDSGGRLKWCPSRCGRAIEFARGATAKGKDLVVFCHCGHSFCWSCTEKPHRTLSCDMARLWMDTIDPRRSKEDMQAAKALAAYKRWMDTDASLRRALKEMEDLKSPSGLRCLAGEVHLNVAKLHFVRQAYEVIIASHRLIRWVHVYEHYRLDAKRDKDRCQHFRDLRNKASDIVTHLVIHARGHRANVVQATPGEYSAFKTDLKKLTRDTRHMVEKLVKEAEKSNN